MKTQGTLYSISAPSGAGKTSLVKALIGSMSQLQMSVSHTTRAIRPGEQDGKDYHFVDESTFLTLQQDDIFLEFATVFKYRYGTSRAWVEEQLATGIDILLEIDWQGHQSVKQQLSGSVGIFILPPSQQALEARLQQRAQDSQAVISHRMAEAQAEMSHCIDYDYLIVNDDFDQALLELQSIIRSQRLVFGQQKARYAGLIDQLLD